VIIVFHGGGQDAITIAKRWYVDSPNPVPADLAGYLLVFPETDPLLDEQWVQFSALNSTFPRLDLVFVEELLTHLADHDFATTSASVPVVRADVGLAYAAGFSNGGGMVWQLLNSALSVSFRGFAAVGIALDPEKVRHYRNELAAIGEVPSPAPVVYVHGTADRAYRPTFMQEETPLEVTLPFFTVTQMLQRNGVPSTVRRALSWSRAGPGSPRWCSRSSSAMPRSCRAR
jgi:poly(3-hydroxybutyrate) depolymerase